MKYDLDANEFHTIPVLELVSLVTEDNFNPLGYIQYNTDVANALGFTEEAAIEHYNSFGKNEIRYQNNPISELMNAREEKKKRLKDILDLSKDFRINEFNAYDFLTPELREQFKIIDTSNVSANDYDYDGYENDESCIILDCGAGYRKNTIKM